MSNYKKFSQVLSNALEIVFPGLCLICGQKLIFNSRPYYSVCNDCYDRFEYIGGRRCRCCSRELISEIDLCTRCRNINYFFDSNISLFEYRDHIKELIYLYKFKNRTRLAIVFADMLINLIKEKGKELPVIPVPSASKKDHILRLAKNLRRKYKIKIINCLKRKGKGQQKELDFKERFKNLRGKILANKRLLNTHKEVILLDDIITTGATLSECARVLKDAGVRRVYAVTIAMD